MKNCGVKYNCLINKKIIVTGGATGIGSVITKYFYQQGSQVIILDINLNFIYNNKINQIN